MDKRKEQLNQLSEQLPSEAHLKEAMAFGKEILQKSTDPERTKQHEYLTFLSSPQTNHQPINPLAKSQSECKRVRVAHTSQKGEKGGKWWNVDEKICTAYK